MQRVLKFTILIIIVVVVYSCSSNHVSTKYYSSNQRTLDSIELSYQKLYAKKGFALQFTDKTFTKISIDILTDSIKYVYVFDAAEKMRMNDTLLRYGLDIQGTNKLINQMRSIRCTWINSLDYYVNTRLRYMTFLSIRQRTISFPFVPAKYYIIVYFARPQYFDDEGRLLAGRRLKILRKINGDIFKRINDSVCYTVSKKFR